MDRLEELKHKYASVLEKIKEQGVVLAHCHVQDDKLYLQGAAPNEDCKNAVWNEIKAVDPSYGDLTCDLSVDASLPPPAPPVKKYTVVGGDTLSKISQHFYGSPNHYMKIAEANGIANPNLIQVGQVLVIPA